MRVWGGGSVPASMASARHVCASVSSACIRSAASAASLGASARSKVPDGKARVPAESLTPGQEDVFDGHQEDIFVTSHGGGGQPLENLFDGPQLVLDDYFDSNSRAGHLHEEDIFDTIWGEGGRSVSEQEDAAGQPRKNMFDVSEHVLDNYFDSGGMAGLGSLQWNDFE